MRLDGNRSAGRNGANPVVLAEQAHALGRGRGDGVVGADMPVGLCQSQQVASGKDAGGGLRGQCNRAGRFRDEPRLPEALGSGAGIRAPGVLLVDAVRIAAVLLRVDGLGQRFERGERSQRQRLLRGGGIGQALGGTLGGGDLAAGFADVEHGAGGPGLDRCRQQQAVAGAHDGPRVGAQFGAGATPGAAFSAGGRLRDHVAKVELGVGGRAGQAHAQLAGVVVDDPLVVAAVAEVVRMPAGQRCVQRRLGGGPGQGVLFVVQLRHDHRAIDVAIEVGQHDLSAGAGQVMHAPVGTGCGGRHAHPGGDLAQVVLGRVGGGVGPGIGHRRAQPGQAHAHAVIALGGQRGAAFGDDDGRLSFRSGGLGRVHRHDRGIGAHGFEAVAVAAGLDVGHAQQQRDLGPQVVGRFMAHRQRDELVRGGVEVPGQREAFAGAQGADAAFALVAQVAAFMRLRAQLRGAAGGIGVGEAVRAARFEGFQRGPFTQAFVAGVGGGGGQGLVVP
ncbi:hypothetical protein CUTA107171_24080 [Cupriavidus taiwanensis]